MIIIALWKLVFSYQETIVRLVFTINSTVNSSEVAPYNVTVVIVPIVSASVSCRRRYYEAVWGEGDNRRQFMRIEILFRHQ